MLAIPDQPIFFEPNRLSGSHLYVYGKTPGEIIDGNSRRMGDLLDHQDGMLAGAARVSRTVAAGTGWMPMEMAGIMTDCWGNWLRSINRTIRHNLDRWTKEIFSNEFAHTAQLADAMLQVGYSLPKDDEVNRRLNYGFFTHNRYEANDPRNGSLNAVDGDDVLPFFPRHGDSKLWPNLLLTSSHALTRNHLDVSGVMKGFHALASDTFRDSTRRSGHELRLIRHLNPSRSAAHGEGKRTIILSSVYNYGNAWGNGGMLINRLLHLDKVYEMENRQDPARGSNEAVIRAWREQAYLGNGKTAMSPASIRLAKLMLKLIADDPQQIAIPERQDFERWGDDLAQSFVQSDEPVRLRPDADKVLQHIKLAGYSKGGNIVTDAVRYLLVELQRQVRGQEKPLFEIEISAGKVEGLNDSIIRNLMLNVGILCVNPGISPMTEREKQLGVRRISVRNENDRISAHLFDRHAMQFKKGEHDDVYVVNPIRTNGNLGHGLIDALGSRDDPKQIGYLLNERNVRFGTDAEREQFAELRSRLQCFFASCYEQVGISHMLKGADGRLELEFSTGVSNEQAQKVESLLRQSLDEQQINISFTCDWKGPGRCYIQMNDTAPDAVVQAHQKIAEALQRIAKDASNGVFVANNVYRTLGVAPDTGHSRL